MIVSSMVLCGFFQSRVSVGCLRSKHFHGTTFQRHVIPYVSFQSWTRDYDIDFTTGPQHPHVDVPTPQSFTIK